MSDDISDDITPALSPEEWAARRPTPHEETPQDGAAAEWIIGPALNEVNGVVMEYVEEGCFRHMDLEPRHAIAALCLYGQPFGFTREDLWAIAHSEAPYFSDKNGGDARHLEAGRAIERVMAKIEALLPPEAS